MKGIVIVSHSLDLAKGVKDLAMQMAGGGKVKIAAAGGLEDGSLGTGFDQIQKAIHQMEPTDGILVLMDLGSAVMTAQMVVEMLEPDQQDKIRLSGAPLVEGALAAAAAAAAGQSLDRMKKAAEQVLVRTPKLEPEEPAEKEPAKTPESSGPDSRVQADLVLTTPSGLHARPAMTFADTAAGFSAEISVQNLSQKKPPVDAKTPMQVAFGGTARKGETIRITAGGKDAKEAVAALKLLVQTGFSEMDAHDSPPPQTRTPDDAQPSRGEPGANTLTGMGICEGFALGPAFLVSSDRKADPEGPGAKIRPEREKARLKAAIRAAQNDLTRIQAQTEAELDKSAGRIFEFQKMMLKDGQMAGQMEAAIEQDRISARQAVDRVFSGWKAKAGDLDDFMKTRTADLLDVENRINAHLAGSETATIRPPRECILVAKDLTPSQVMQMDRSKVKGMALAMGGAGSHVAVLARSLKIPTVMGLGPPILSIAPHTLLALDGGAGTVEKDPPEKRAAFFKKQALVFDQFQQKAVARAHEPAVTLDGKKIRVLANGAGADSVKEALAMGAEGMGLLRTEFLFLNRNQAPDEEEQYRVFRRIAEIMSPNPVTLRTLDAGGDKPLPFLRLSPQANPQLGKRGIRLCLQRPDIFQPQLRAMLRAAAHGNIKIMFPMVAVAKEAAMAKAALAEARNSLAKDGLDHGKNVAAGIMVEVPSAALNARVLAGQVDFFSLGTNDLAQYTLACDRTSPEMAYLYDPLNPAVLKLIRQVVKAAKAAGKPVSLCGEMAGEKQALPVLLGLGLAELSVSPGRVPLVKQWIREADFAQCRDLAEKYLETETGDFRNLGASLFR